MILLKTQLKSIDHKFFKSFFYGVYFFIIKQINKIYQKKFIYKNTHFINIYKKNKLSKLCEKYGTDKGFVNFYKKKPFPWKPHTYSNYYYNLFNPFKDKIKLVFECGIGSNNLKFSSNMATKGKPGASLRVWKDYFTRANIYGADIDRDILFNENRIKTFYVNQLEKNSIYKMWKAIKKRNFDIIIDDGMHSYQAAITFFMHSYNKLRSGGYYIIEDVSYSYLKKLSEALKNYNFEIIKLETNLHVYNDNNLIVLRKE
jgi:hypothetical protein